MYVKDKMHHLSKSTKMFILSPLQSYNTLQWGWNNAKDDITQKVKRVMIREYASLNSVHQIHIH